MAIIQQIIKTVAATALLSHLCWAAGEEVTCTTCHTPEADQLAQSVHVAIRCQECHKGETSYLLSVEEANRHTQVRPGGGPRPAFDHGPVFTGKPSRAEVPQRCGGCHADVERMNPYGLRTDQLSRYWTSNHGKTLANKGDDRVAVCVDCHGEHDVLPGHEPGSKTHTLNVPETCASCHSDRALMAEFDLSIEVVEEYRQSVHGRLLEQQDTGAPTCAACHGNHSAMPPGFATVGAVCGKCHQHAADSFAASAHAGMEDHKGCVQCHGGGEGRHFHLIERITKPSGVLIERYAHLLASDPVPDSEQVAEAIHPNPKQIMTRAMPLCMECHDEIEEDESLAKLFDLLDAIAQAEGRYVQTGRRLDEIGQGVLLVDRQRFLFEDAKTHLIELAPLQHSLDNQQVAGKVAELNAVCDQVSAELDNLERGLRWRRNALTPIWVFATVFAVALYIKFKRLKRTYVRPLPKGHAGR